MTMTPLMNDGFDGEPAKRVLNYMHRQKEKGMPIVGIYCGYAPIELIQAMGIVPAVLCAFSKAPIASAETVLPANLCPLIKSTYGYHVQKSNPFRAKPDRGNRSKRHFPPTAEQRPCPAPGAPIPRRSLPVDFWRLFVII